MTPVQIKVFGERNTATRAVIRMIDGADGVRGAGHPGVASEDLAGFKDLEQRLDVSKGGAWKKVYREAIRDLREERLGVVGAWKHTAPEYGPDFSRFDVRVLFMVRNPYSWAVSLHRRPYHFFGHRIEDFDAFLRFPWMTMGRDRVDKILDSPIDLWTRKLQSYQSFEKAAQAAGTDCETLRFEDFVSDPEVSLGHVLSRLVGFDVTVRELAEPTKPDGLGAEARRVYYDQEGWKQGLTASSVAYINERVDWELAARYGYERLTPDDFPSSG